MTIAEINLKDSVMGLVGGRVFPAMLPIGTELPAIVYSRISGVPVGLLYQDTGGTEVHVQLDIYAETYAAVRSLVGQVRSALDGAMYVTRLESEQSSYEQDTRLHRALLDVYVYEP